MKRSNQCDSEPPPAESNHQRTIRFGLGSLFLLVSMAGLLIAAATHKSPTLGVIFFIASTFALRRVRLFHARQALKLVAIGGVFVCAGLLPFEFVGWLTPAFAHEGYGIIVLVGYVVSLFGACMAACGLISLLISLTDRLTTDEHQSDPRH